MHVKEIAHHISQQRKKETFRGTVEATIGTHVKKLKAHSRIAKVGPGFYGLPDWPQQIKDSWSQIANQ